VDPKHHVEKILGEIGDGDVTVACFPPAFERLARENAAAVIVPANGLFRTNRAQIAYLGLSEHVPTIADQRLYVEAGVLASYGVDEKENYRRAAAMLTGS
jgi:ABC-type uncharacterized transport system substrate-binding protein